MVAQYVAGNLHGEFKIEQKIVFFFICLFFSIEKREVHHDADL